MTHDHDPAHEDEHDHEHEHGPLAELVTVRDWLRYAVTRFNRAGCFYGHGLQDAYDEAVYLILHTLALPLDRLEPFLDACIPGDEREDILEVIEKRAVDRLPAAYITGEAWLGEFRFQVDKRVIIPRSYFAELLHDGFTPWVQDPDAVTAAMDMCTGSGCLAVLLADLYPDADVDAVDLSADALAVAQINVEQYGLQERIELIQSDLFSALAGREYDLIISNPPYVDAPSVAALPEEYLREPALALGSGEDGLDATREILRRAPAHLSEHGVLVVEIGHNREALEASFPELPFTWLPTASGDGFVFLLTRDELLAAQA